jgi:PAS domain S-box-containing protein
MRSENGGTVDAHAATKLPAAQDEVIRVMEQEDFTERRQAKRALQESWRRLADVMENIPGGFVAFDRNWNFTYINAWAAHNVGRQSQDLIGKNLWATFPKVLGTSYESYYRRVMGERVAVHFEALGVVTDRWYENRVFPTPEGIAVFATDITERKGLERELQERRLERENLLQQQVAFQTASAIAHELNQPLFAVAANSEAALRMLKAGNPQPEKLVNALEASVRQAQRAGQSTRQLLEFFDKNNSLTEALDLNEEVLNALHTVRSDYEMAFKSVLELEKDLPLAQANRVHVQKVLVNLLRNGVEAMEEAGVPAPAGAYLEGKGSRSSVGTGQWAGFDDGRYQTYFSAFLYHQGQWHRNGPQDQPFFDRNQRRGALGRCGRRARRHVSLHLALCPMSAQAPVYVVDDDAAVRDALTLLLESAGHSVETYSNPQAFLAACTPESRGCIILDVNMPVMDGPMLQEELLSRDIHLPVIFLSAHGNIPITVRAIKAGAVDFLTKPVEGDVLLDRVQTALEQNARMQEQTRAKRLLSARLANLTERERDVMTLAVAGHTNKEIAKRLDISYRTVEIHRARVMQKTGASNLLELARIAEGQAGATQG